MKKTTFLLLILVCVGLACLKGNAQPAPPVEATTTQVGAGTLGYPFVVTPRGLAGGFNPIYTNVTLSTLTNVSQGVANTSSNLLYIVLFTTNTLTATNQPFTVGQAIVYVGTNALGQPVFKGTNWPTGGGGSTIPSVLGAVTNTAGGVVGVSTALPGTWIAPATLPQSVADTTWPPATNAVMTTNSPIASRSGQVPRMTGGTNTYGAPTANITNLFVYDLEFHVNTNTFTNVVVGTIGPITNKDGFIFYIPIGTNMP